MIPKVNRRQRMTFQNDYEVVMIRKALSNLIKSDSLSMKDQLIAIEVYKKVDCAWQKRDV